MKTQHRRAGTVIVIFFIFMLLHQTDKLLIGSMTTNIMATFGINEAQMGAVGTVALIVGAILYPVWGYLYDRYARAKLVALASFIWGATTWLSAIAPTYPTFMITRASTGVDDSSYPGIYSLVADYFGPTLRGKVYGLLQLAQPLGFMIGLAMGLFLTASIGWRGVYYITGTMGLIVAALIFFFVKDVPRGQAEPEMANLEEMGIYRFDMKEALGLFRKRSLLLLFAQGFAGVFPWQVIAFWIVRYLQTERGYEGLNTYFTLVPAILVLAFGYFFGGTVGDALFKRTPRGRMITAFIGVLTGAILLNITLRIPNDQQLLFAVMLSATALFIPLASPNVISTVYDITLPEVRSTALSVQYFIENAGAALAPLMAGYIATKSNLGTAIILICTVAWMLGAFFLGFTAYLVPRDIATLRQQMRDRADREMALQKA